MSSKRDIEKSGAAGNFTDSSRHSALRSTLGGLYPQLAAMARSIQSARLESYMATSVRSASPFFVLAEIEIHKVEHSAGDPDPVGYS